VTVARYGSWRSPISADMVASGGVSIGQLRVSGGFVWWTEGRPLEAGRQALVRRDPDGTIAEQAPGFNARTTVHEYGGGAYLAYGDTVFFSSFDDQRMYRVSPGREPAPITPEPSTRWGLRYADACLTADGAALVCVRESHEAAGEAVNEIVSLPIDGSEAPRVLASGRDFYAAPRPSHDGAQIAWICWDHPRMPWDGTELYVSDGQGAPRLVTGGESESVIEPTWAPDGTLYFCSDRTGWWNLYRERDGRIEAVAAMEAELGGPQWVFGLRHFVFLDDGRIACVYRSEGMDHLATISPESAVKPLQIEFTSIGSIDTDGTSIWIVGAGAAAGSTIARIDPDTARTEVVKRARGDLPDARYLSTPRAIEFPTENALTAHALFYAPRNSDFDPPAGERPPLVVFSHGGPTGATSSALNLTIQYFTSRGLAVVDVNYGGSTGYGREYRDRLKDAWGIVDVADCANAARWLAEQGEVDGDRLAIRGGSAGGYTTLCALAFTDAFSCGASYFGVADAEALARDTHKFESRYLDGLIGPYPAAVAVYRERSAIHHVDKISCPVIFFQGLEDKVVPPAQAEEMVAALAAKGLPHAYLAFEGEQHGFRRAENVKRSLEAELYFYSRVLGFEPGDAVEPVQIENL
jgi:dipeptidyl aminopeptidase/acylaminoacyl peptidase